MRRWIADTLAALARRVAPKALPAGCAAPGGLGLAGPARRGHREPRPADLLAELRQTAYSCATINAAVCASFRPVLYVSTAAGQPEPKCATRPVPEWKADALGRRRGTKTVRYQEVLAHPLLTLLESVNPCHNAHDLYEQTTLCQEAEGNAYWLLDRDAFGVPARIWVIPPQNVNVLPDAAGYEVRTAVSRRVRYGPDDVIHFSYPDPRDPYGPGLSPLRACFESVTQASQYQQFRSAVWENVGLPGAVVSPKSDQMSPDERDRLAEEWEQKFRAGGNGRVLVGEQGLEVTVLKHELADMAVLAEARATKEDIANAFGVPLSYLTKETNLANLQAADQQHARLTDWPRLVRRDEKLNEKLVPLFDPSGRLFLESENPIPRDLDHDLKRRRADLETGVRTINEVRSADGLPPVPWGDEPWLPLAAAPPSFPRAAYGPGTGRNRDQSVGGES